MNLFIRIVMCGAVFSHTMSPAIAQEQSDLDRIPQTTDPPPPLSAASNSQRSLYLENAISVSSPRDRPAVPLPAAPQSDWQERLFFDTRRQWIPESKTRLTYSGRLNLRDADDIPVPS